jgi:hypothetical protein
MKGHELDVHAARIGEMGGGVQEYRRGACSEETASRPMDTCKDRPNTRIQLAQDKFQWRAVVIVVITFSSHKIWLISWIAERLSTFQAGVMELADEPVSYLVKIV